MLSYAEEEGRVNFLTSLLEVLILALRKSSSDSPEVVDLMFQPFEVIADIMRVSQNPNPVIKCSVCIKSYLLYYYPQVEQRKFGPRIYELLDRLLNPKEIEVLSYYVGNILMILFEKVPAADQMPKNDVHNELLRKLVTKLAKCMLPSTVQGILPEDARDQRHEGWPQDRDGPLAAAPAEIHRQADQERDLQRSHGHLRFEESRLQRPAGARLRPVPHARLARSLRTAEDPLHTDQVLPERKESHLQRHGRRRHDRTLPRKHARRRQTGHLRRRTRNGRRRPRRRRRRPRLRRHGRTLV